MEARASIQTEQETSSNAISGHGGKILMREKREPGNEDIVS